MNTTRNNINEEWFRVPLVAILIFETAALIARSFFEVRLRDSGYEPYLAAHLSYFAVPSILLTLMFPVLRKHGHLLLGLFRIRDLSVRVIIIGITLGLVLRLAFWGSTIAMTSFGFLLVDVPIVTIGPQFSWQCPPAAHLGLGIIVMACLVPMIEESVFRGLILHRLSNRAPLIAILLSSFLFAITHNPQTIFLAFVIGVYLAFAARNSRGLWISLFAHSSYNLAAQIDWRCLHGQWVPSEVTRTMLGVGALATALFLVNMLLAALLVSRRIIEPPEQPDDAAA